MAIFHWNIDQGSLAWHKLRSGVPTASEFDKVLTPKKQELAAARHKYACRLIAERLLKWQPDSLDKVQHIADGKAGEGPAVQQLEWVTGTQTKPVGFVTTADGRFGASPDRVIGQHETSVDVVLEVKAPTIPTQMQYLLLGHEEAYRCQVMGQLWVAEADKAIFYSYQNRMPAYMVETGRDEAFIHKLAGALEQFSDELEALMEKAQTLGVFQAFEEVVSPVDAAYGNDAATLADMVEGDDGKWNWAG